MVGSQRPLQFCCYSCLCKTSDDIIFTYYISYTTTTTITTITTSITTNNPTTAASNNNSNLYVNFLREVPSSVLEILAATYSPTTKKRVTFSQESEQISKSRISCSTHVWF